MLDAAGNTPRELTPFEKKWRSQLQGGEFQKRYDALHERLGLPLKEKIELSLDRIAEWYEAFDGKVSVSYSGGADSSVLLWLVRRRYPDVQGVFCHTGLEYPEVVRIVLATSNIKIVRPKISFREVLKRYGYPLVSKKVARGVSILQNPTDKNQNIYRLYESGVNRFGEKVNGFQVPKRWKFLRDAPFKISDKCCQVMKKDPMRIYERESGNVQFVGMMAKDSKAREKTYLQHGCNAYDLKTPHSTPLSFWTKQDVMQCLKVHSIPYPDVYGDIVRDNRTGKAKFTGVTSTGCVFCCFGLHMEDNPNRFQRLYDTHPKMWKICMDSLGLRDVIGYLERNTEGKLKGKFKIKPYCQMGLFN